ncbi:MAG: hydroxymethylglutaryl-CoA lyase, partial [Syntrophales bacterium]|nr:hydroxymethylglutaryl-CoA lyase [Syntrophales bacterium]
ATETKVALIRKLAACGLREIQIGAFVNPRAIPQFRDMTAVAAALVDVTDVTFNVLVPNVQGARAALAAGIRKLVYFFSVTEGHNINNVRRSREESFAGLGELVKELPPQEAVLTVALATVFGCPFEGYAPTEEIRKWVERTASLGIREITLCDTVGYGHPALIEEVLDVCLTNFPDVEFAVHLHNTRGLGLANALRAWDMGIRRFDAAIGGLGGCPFAPGASGNIATEDMVFMFNAMGCRTGVSTTALLDTASFLQESLPGIVLTSSLSGAGLPRRFPLPYSDINTEQC